MISRNTKKICSRLGFALAAMFIIFNGSHTAISAWVEHHAPYLWQYDWFPWLINTFSLYLLGLPIFLLILHFIPDGPIDQRPRQPFGSKLYLYCMVFCMGSSYIIAFIVAIPIFLIQAILGGEGISSAQEVMSQSNLLTNFLFGVVLPAIAEEFIFRYMLLKKLRGSSDTIFIFFSGLSFGLFHGNLLQFSFTALTGAILAWVYLQTRNLLFPISMHFIYNFISIVLLEQFIPYNTAIILFFIAFIALIVGAVILYNNYKEWFFYSLYPPLEAGWPFHPWTPKHLTVQYVGWYQNYARQATYNQKYQQGMAPPYSPVGFQQLHYYNYGTYAAPPQQHQYAAYPYHGYLVNQNYNAAASARNNRREMYRLVLGNPGMTIYLVTATLIIFLNLVILILPT